MYHRVGIATDENVGARGLGLEEDGYVAQVSMVAL